MSVKVEEEHRDRRHLFLFQRSYDVTVHGLEHSSIPRLTQPEVFNAPVAHGRNMCCVARWAKVGQTVAVAWCESFKKNITYLGDGWSKQACKLIYIINILYIYYVHITMYVLVGIIVYFSSGCLLFSLQILNSFPSKWYWYSCLSSYLTIFHVWHCDIWLSCSVSSWWVDEHPWPGMLRTAWLGVMTCWHPQRRSRHRSRGDSRRNAGKLGNIIGTTAACNDRFHHKHVNKHFIA